MSFVFVRFVFVRFVFVRFVFVRFVFVRNRSFVVFRDTSVVFGRTTVVGKSWRTGAAKTCLIDCGSGLTLPKRHHPSEAPRADTSRAQPG
jgi:hypothetical protein